MEFKTQRFLCLKTLSGVSSTMRLASSSASSSHPAIAAADLNRGLKRVFTFWQFPSVAGFFWFLGLRLWSSLTIFCARVVWNLGNRRDLVSLQRRRNKGYTNYEVGGITFPQRSNFLNKMAALAIVTAIISGAVLLYAHRLIRLP